MNEHNLGSEAEDMNRELLFSQKSIKNLPIEYQYFLEYYYGKEEWVKVRFEELLMGDRVDQAEACENLKATIDIRMEFLVKDFLDITEQFDPDEKKFLQDNWQRYKGLRDLLVLTFLEMKQDKVEDFTEGIQHIRIMVQILKEKVKTAEIDEAVLNLAKMVLNLAKELTVYVSDSWMTHYVKDLLAIIKASEVFGKTEFIKILENMRGQKDLRGQRLGFTRIIQWLKSRK